MAKEIKSRMHQLAKYLNIESFLKRELNTLSGEQKQF